MNDDREPVDGLDHHLRDRMDRAVGGLRAPDVLPLALARGARRRRHRSVAYAVGGVAAATALALAVPAFAQDWPGRDTDPTTPSVAADPSGSAPASPTASSGKGASGEDACGAAATGWWSKSTEEIRDELAGLLPAGVGIGETDDHGSGTWGGNLVSGGDADFASVTLLPPPGVPGGRRTLAELSSGGPCAGGSNAPSQPVRPCAELTGNESCQEIRSADGTLVGVVTDKVERTVVDRQEQPTDRAYVLATLAGPGGGHVEVYVAEGTRADRPSTVHDPADVPALDAQQVRAILTDPFWTS
ncbi:hypothetical protein H5V45_12860 [Nocardioides sp. KIGAM211]|uniref:Uncharacterized protein n=1 Tax=Nocardioides luti TaxID=2761101 RepID=A0A7X0VCH3_9ACTN|nr:hypothetical protein [Nocardioides luti]MBB6628213.1 hypothetical protein [Nocardioides luti]